MILNDIQYESAKEALKGFKGALKFTKSKSDKEQWLKEIELADLQYLIEKFKTKISKYENLKSGKIKFESQYFIDDLPLILPQIRIASGMTQSEVANLADIDERKFRQLEDSEYYESDWQTIARVAKVLGVNLAKENKKSKKGGILQKKVENCVEKLLSESNTPLHYFDIANLVSSELKDNIDHRTARDAASNVGMLFDFGTFGLSKHVPLSRHQKKTVLKEIEKLTSSKNHKKNWHASEILKELNKNSKNLPDALNMYLINIILKDSNALDYIGIMTWRIVKQSAKVNEQSNGKCFMNLKEHIIKVLMDNNGKPLRSMEIAERAKRNGWKTDSKETTAVVRTTLHGRLKGHVLPDGRKIVQAGEGLFGLSKSGRSGSKTNVQTAKMKGLRTVSKSNAGTTSKNKLTLKDHIVKVLVNNNGKPLRSREIAERAKRNGWNTAAKETTMAIRTTLHGKLKGHVLPDGRKVVQAGVGLFGLSKARAGSKRS